VEEAWSAGDCTIWMQRAKCSMRTSLGLAGFGTALAVHIDSCSRDTSNQIKVMIITTQYSQYVLRLIYHLDHTAVLLHMSQRSLIPYAVVPFQSLDILGTGKDIQPVFPLSSSAHIYL
jgi:hypothetical protein